MDLNKPSLLSLGMRYSEEYDELKSNRDSFEDQWLKNYNQYKGVYDAEILAQIPAGHSKAYPKITRVKVKALIGKLMEMLFPTSERNWELKPTPIPRLKQEQMQAILDQLREANQQGQLDDETIAKAIKEWTAKQAERMSEEIADQLAEVDFESLSKKVIKSAVIYGIGVLRGPMVKKYEVQKWERTQDENGQETITAYEEEVLRPFFDFVSIWDWFPDYSLRAMHMNERVFERHIMSRHEVFELAKRNDFDADQIKTYLHAHQDGDYTESSTDLLLRQQADITETPGKRTNLFEVKQRVGFVDAKQLRSAGIDVPEDTIGDVLMDIWLLGQTIIKFSKLPYDHPMEFYHTFIFDEEDETAAIGPAVPENVRDSQMAVSAASRMLMDNASITCGPVFELNRDLLEPGQENMRIHAFKYIWRNGDDQRASAPAVRTYKFDSHINELMSIINMFREMSDEESMLPKWAIGAESRPSEGMRTASGTSMLFGAANITVKDVVRGYDKFVSSMLTSLYKWNDMFNPREDIKGDFNIIARGATSLLAKELRAQAMDNMVMTMSPEDREEVDNRKFLEERFKVRDLEPENLLLPPETVQQNRDQRLRMAEAEANAKNAETQARAKKLLTSAAAELVNARKKGELTDAQITEIMSKAEKNLAGVENDNDKITLELLGAMQEATGEEPQTMEQQL